MLPKVNKPLAIGSMRRLFPYSLILSTFQIIIWLRLAKTPHIPAMNAQQTNEMPAHHFFARQNACFSQFPTKNVQEPAWPSLAQKVTLMRLYDASIHLKYNIAIIYTKLLSSSVSECQKPSRYLNMLSISINIEKLYHLSEQQPTNQKVKSDF